MATDRSCFYCSALSIFVPLFPRTQADRDGSGRLEPREVAVLLRRLAPDTRTEDLRTAVAVMFRNMVRAHALATAHLAHALQPFSATTVPQPLVPAPVVPRHNFVRLWIVSMQDHDGDGTLSFQEFMYALRAVDLQTPDRTLRAGSWQVARAGAYPASRCGIALQPCSNAPPLRPSYHCISCFLTPPDLWFFRANSHRAWSLIAHLPLVLCVHRAVAAAPAAREPLLQTLDLEEVVVLRQRYLWARATNVVYEWMPPQGSGQPVPAWPKALGLLDRDRCGMVNVLSERQHARRNWMSGCLHRAPSLGPMKAHAWHGEPVKP